MTKRQRELDLEREWELYRLDVVERMPDSAYKTAVLASHPRGKPDRRRLGVSLYAPCVVTVIDGLATDNG
jgi:hypothetical protein